MFHDADNEVTRLGPLIHYGYWLDNAAMGIDSLIHYGYWLDNAAMGYKIMLTSAILGGPECTQVSVWGRFICRCTNCGATIITEL